jgi:hypothetical protein
LRRRPTIGGLKPLAVAETQEDNGLNPQGTDPKLIDALNRASSLELFQLSAIIERMLADPRRIIAVRTNMHMGQTVRFLDWRDGQMRNGRVVAMGDTKVTLREEGARHEWKLPYAAVEPPTGAVPQTPPPPAPPQLKPGRGDFRVLFSLAQARWRASPSVPSLRS